LSFAPYFRPRFEGKDTLPHERTQWDHISALSRSRRNSHHAIHSRCTTVKKCATWLKQCLSSAFRSCWALSSDIGCARVNLRSGACGTAVDHAERLPSPALQFWLTVKNELQTS